jgi:hypothetical protein
MANNTVPSVRQFSPPPTDLTDHTMSAEESRLELQHAIRGSNQVLASTHTVLALFPDTMIIDRAKVTITKRQFFRMADVMSVRIEDVLNATCTLGPVFGTVTIVSRVMSENQTITIGRFLREEAMRLKRVLQGYVIALQRKIDCSNLETSELADMLEKLGADDHPNT